MLRPAVVVTAVLTALAFACSTSPHAAPTPPGSACGDGYLEAVNGVCPTGTCLEPEAGASCCGSQCATCEDKGLIASEDGGACPAGTCVSTDVTVALSCCDTCPGEDASVEASMESGAEAGAEAGAGDAAADAGNAGDAASD
jgi:hypothetical protein